MVDPRCQQQEGQEGASRGHADLAPCFPPVFLLCPAPHSLLMLAWRALLPSQWTVCTALVAGLGGPRARRHQNRGSKPGAQPANLVASPSQAACLLAQPACSPELLPASQILFQLSTGLGLADQESTERKEEGWLQRGWHGLWRQGSGRGGSMTLGQAWGSWNSFQSGACSAAPEGMEQLASAPGWQSSCPLHSGEQAGWEREVRQTVKLEVSALAGNIPLNDSVVSLFLLWTALMSQLHMLFTAHCDQQQCAEASGGVEAQCQCGRKVDTARDIPGPSWHLPSQQGHRVS